MASLIDTNSSAPKDARVHTPSGRVLVMDRSQSFVQARRHSFIVRALKLLLPVSSVLIVGGYIGLMVTTARLGGAIDRKGQVTTLSRELTMDNPRYEGITKDGGRFLVTARTALPDFGNSGRIRLNTISGEIVDVRKSRTDLSANRGVFDSKANQLDLEGGITIITATGMRAELQTATIATREGTLRSNTPARVTAPQGKIVSNRLELDQKSKKVAFIDQVIANLAPPEPGAAAKSAGPATVFGSSRSPVDVTADRLDIDDAAKTAVFSGNVRAQQASAADVRLGAEPVTSAIETTRLEIKYAGSPEAAATPSSDAVADPASPVPPPPAKAAGPGPAKVERIVVPEPLVMTQGSGARVTGDRAEFDAIGEVAVVAGHVTMASGPDRRASSERAEFNQRSDTILLTGSVIVTQGSNELRGRRLFVDRKAGRTDLSSPADGGLPRSRIFARLTQGNAAEKAAKHSSTAVAPPPPEGEGAGGLGIATFKTDPTAPVEVEADRLVVEDTRKEATFTGEVKAAQGEFLIKSSELKATYSGDTGLVADPAAGTPATAGGAGRAPAQLTRIDAKGKVVVTSKASQQVTGDWAVFDTKANSVVVGGADVVLTQGPNIVKGNKLVIDMTTGQSVMTRDAVASPAAVSAKPGRSSVIFYPSSHEKKAGTEKPGGTDGAAVGKPATPPKPSSSSWGATAEPAKPN